ncbi:unnamed protein product [Rotaria sp. Silwood1]|nr:unnamed protein product [Rotaria sp. Silwood1]CAF3421763.1 unnamed protein product [Rotaria sp. Silwood1]CAF3426144.1 unnamed protein product [Rotaria sp. Silwood1]CAF4566702.1 unnamed protein product [Rotaria sp. Silwood1]CAF4787340.1 unnamed protein product [Rotaria sp. Silwood1]
MSPKGQKRKLKTNESLPIAKKLSHTDDHAIIEAATITAAPTAKQLDPKERRRKFMAYKSFLNRGGPDAPGSKDIPQGAEDCLKSLTFVITGVLPSLERDECKKIIESYGGRVTTAVSGKTDYLVAGRDEGKTKTEKAKKLHIKIISEDDLLEMIRTRPGSTNVDVKSTIIKSHKPTVLKPIDSNAFVPISSTKLKFYKQVDDILWVDKYKPTSLSQIVGQQTDKSPMKKLIYFLTNWHTWHTIPATSKRKKTATISTSITSSDPSKFKAVLLTGPPGVGKTTVAQLVCKALNLPYIEQNASDNRSQTMMGKIELNSAYLTDDNQTMNKHVLIMDEVDGVSGNEDRGGIQTLIKLLRTTHIPIIFIANDRQTIKMRTLASYCYEIKFDRPSFLNVKSFILDICSREHIHITHSLLDNLINSCNRDIRKIIHTLNLYYKQSSSTISNMTNIEKALSTSPFDACMKMFSLSNINLIDKTNLYFHDSSLVPLLIQDNYVRVVPSITIERKPIGTRQRMELISKAADSLALGDICSKFNFISGSRSLMGYQAMFSGVIPTTYLHGSLNVVQFPAWFGHMQQQKSTDRHLIELETHCSLKTMTIDRKEFNLDYLPLFNYLFNHFLQKKDIKDCLELMNNYYFNSDDLQLILSMNSYQKMNLNKNELDTKTKTLLTKSLEKQHHRTPFKQIDINKIKPGMTGAREDDDDYNMAVSDDNDDDDNNKENMIIDNDIIKTIKQKPKRRKRT